MLFEIKRSENILVNSKYDLHKLGEAEMEGKLKVNKAQVARELGISVKTVNKYMKGFIPPQTRNCKSQIDEFYEIILDLIQDENQRFFYRRVLWQYLKDNYGLSCAESSFRRWVSKHDEISSYFNGRTNRTINNKVRNCSTTHKHVLHYPSQSGEYASIDWKESMTFILSNGKHIEINIFAFVLSYSKYKIYYISLDKSQDILFHHLNKAFEQIGGVPQKIRTDNMKIVMDKARTEYSSGNINSRFAQFAKEYGFEVCPCRAGEPEVKADVESPMKILDELYAYNGQLTLFELNNRLRIINNRVNMDLNKNLNIVPMTALQKERDFLSPVPKEKIRNLYNIATEPLKVSKQSTITYHRMKFVVDPNLIGKTVNIQAYNDYLHIYFNTDLVGIYSLSECCSYNTTPSLQKKLTKLSLGFNTDDNTIQRIAKGNLDRLGEIYK